MTETDTRRPTRNWVALVITTLLGIAATVAVGWYQLSQAERQALLAEEERARAARERLVSIVEEHVLNDKPIDVPRLVRLIDQRRRQERVAISITVAELLEQAEFNILGSRYLSFDRKQALKGVFDTLYSDVSTRTFAPYSPSTPNADLLNSLARQIQDGKTSEALQTLKRVQEAYTKDVQQSPRGGTAPSLIDALRELLKNPFPVILIPAVYVLLAIWLMTRRTEVRRILRRMIGPRLSPSEARDRIATGRKAGVPDEMIVDRLWELGVPRDWALEEIRRSSEPAASPQKASPRETVEPERV